MSSTSNNVVIRTADLTKVYRLYSQRLYRALDIMGLLPAAASSRFRQHVAIDRVTLSIQRGERVAIIGRNGSGKSTLLKLIAGVIQPTAGSVEVKGTVHALLQIGTGFHADLTGRQNVYGYLAQLGVTGLDADRRYEEVVDFAELHEYIDQPVKSFSTGMTVRLMFATSTAITPNLLILDEVLGVGDAYFTQKSYGRIRELSSGGTTLLLVTHEVYSAARLCDRMIWIERGRVMLDGPPARIVSAYEDSIRLQEEERVRARHAERVAKRTRVEADAASKAFFFVEISARGNAVLSAPVYFSRIALHRDDVALAELPLTVSGIDEDTAESHLLQEGSAWTDVTSWQGRTCRALRHYGSPFHKVSGVLAVERGRLATGSSNLVLSVDSWSSSSAALSVNVYRGRDLVASAAVTQPANAWSRTEMQVPASDTPTSGRRFLPSDTGSFGAGDIVIREAGFVDASGAPAFVLMHGAPARLIVEYEILNPCLAECAQIAVAVHRDGVQDVCRFLARDLRFDARTPRGRVQLDIPRLSLTDGTYTISVMIAKEGYYDRDQPLFYAANPEVYSVRARFFEVVVEGAGLIGSGTMAVPVGSWSMESN